MEKKKGSLKEKRLDKASGVELQRKVKGSSGSSPRKNTLGLKRQKTAGHFTEPFWPRDSSPEKKK